MENKPPKITTIDFPDGQFNYVYCVIAMMDEDIMTSTFEAFIGIGIDINIDTCSNQYLKFDESNVFCYAVDIDEFFDWYNNGGWDFKILDYELEVNNV